MKIIKSFVKYKIYVARASSYITILNTGMILILFLSKLQDYGINLSIKKYTLLIFITSLILFGLIGYIDETLGLFKYETTITQNNNNEMQKIMNDLEIIKKELKTK